MVIINKEEYTNKINEILNDENKFKIINEDITKLVHKLEGKVNRFLKGIKNANIISNEEYNQLTPTGTTPGILYGLPKVHKENYPMRPILSAINTHTYNMSKFIIPLISNWSRNEYTINDSFSFVNEIKYKINNNYYMASFDIESLYTNIPLIETINIILQLAFTNNNKFHNFKKFQFKKLLELSLLDTHFLFNNNLYKQINGLAMGQPVAPVMANIFLCYHERKWLENCPPEFKPIIYKRYIDDSFLLFREKHHIDLFLNYLNNCHNCIKFTKEVEKENCLNFLDIKITKNNNKFSTSIYRKPTFTGLTMNFQSFAPLKYKINLIKTLIHRAFSISSSYLNFHQEVEFLKNLLINNGFKLSIILKQIRKFLEKQYSTLKIYSTVPKQEIYLKLPFYGNESYIIKKKLQNLIRNYYPQVNLKVILTSNFRIKNYFNFKDKAPDTVQSLVVYKYICNRCNSVYVGKTSRHLSTRISEHIGISFRTGIPLTSPPFSQIRSHIEESQNTHQNYRITKEQFKIIAKAPSNYDLTIKESIFIKLSKPNLNNMDSINLKIF